MGSRKGFQNHHHHHQHHHRRRCRRRRHHHHHIIVIIIISSSSSSSSLCAKTDYHKQNSNQAISETHIVQLDETWSNGSNSNCNFEKVGHPIHMKQANTA